MRLLRQIDRLTEQLDRLMKEPQTGDREMRKVRLELEIAELRGRRAIEVAQLTRGLIDSYVATGRMVVAEQPSMRDGAPSPDDPIDLTASFRVFHSSPVIYGVNEVQQVQNVLGEAQRLVRMVLG